MSKRQKRADPSKDTNKNQLATQIKRNKQIQEIALAAASADYCNSHLLVDHPWEWVSAHAIRRFYIRDPEFRSKFSISPSHAKILQFTAAVFALIMILVWTAPQKFEAVFSTSVIGFFGVLTSALVQFVFVDFTLVQMSALVLISCRTLTPVLKDGDKAVSKRLEVIRQDFFPRSVARSTYLLISFGSAVVLPLLFPLGGWWCITTGVTCNRASQVLAAIFNVGVLLVLTTIFAVPVARFTNETPDSAWLHEFIRRNAGIMNPEGTEDLGAVADEKNKKE